MLLLVFQEQCFPKGSVHFAATDTCFLLDGPFNSVDDVSQRTSADKRLASQPVGGLKAISVLDAKFVTQWAIKCPFVNYYRRYAHFINEASQIKPHAFALHLSMAGTTLMDINRAHSLPGKAIAWLQDILKPSLYWIFFSSSNPQQRARASPVSCLLFCVVHQSDGKMVQPEHEGSCFALNSGSILLLKLHFRPHSWLFHVDIDCLLFKIRIASQSFSPQWRERMKMKSGIDGRLITAVSEIR